jgi:tRNA(Ile)-lysidine synthase
MIKVLTPLPRELTVALSGGVDSIAVADFLSKNHDIVCAFFHHGTENSERALKFVSDFCNERNLVLVLGTFCSERSPGQSQEEYWRNERYKFLDTIPGTVVTAHNLDDCVETYIHSAMHGNPKVIPLYRNNVVRPFLTTHKSEFVNWCKRKNIEWCEDQSNTNTDFTRNYIRHMMMPHALHVNPGLPKTVKKIVQRQLTNIHESAILAEQVA